MSYLFNIQGLGLNIVPPKPTQPIDTTFSPQCTHATDNTDEPLSLIQIVNQTCCEYSINYKSVAQLKENLGGHFERAGKHLLRQIKSIKRVNDICAAGTSISKEKVINAGIT